MCGIALFALALAGAVLMLRSWGRMEARRRRSRDEMRGDGDRPEL
jgi:hypothetical protein